MHLYKDVLVPRGEVAHAEDLVRVRVRVRVGVRNRVRVRVQKTQSKSPSSTLSPPPSSW